MLQRNLTVGDSLQDTREHSLFGVLEAGGTAKNVTCSLGCSWVGVHTAAEAFARTTHGYSGRDYYLLGEPRLYRSPKIGSMTQESTINLRGSGAANGARTGIGGKPFPCVGAGSEVSLRVDVAADETFTSLQRSARVTGRGADGLGRTA